MTNSEWVNRRWGTRQKALDQRRKRWREYELAATAVCDADAGLAEVHVDVARIILENDLEQTGGQKLSPEEPRSVDVDVPPLAELESEREGEDERLMAMCSDLLEAVERDPTVVPAADEVGGEIDGC